jgi:hypothetical protein
MKYAIVENKNIINVIEANEDFINNYYPNAILLDDDSQVSIGWTYDGKAFKNTIVMVADETETI